MSAFEPAQPNKIDKGLITPKIRAKYFEEYIGLTPLSVFMGNEPSDPIQVFEMQAGQGMAFRVPFARSLDYTNPVMGNNQVEGAEQQVEVYQDEIRLDQVRFSEVMIGQHIIKQITPLDLFGKMRSRLKNANQGNLVKTLFDAATTDIYNVEGLHCNGIARGPTVDRVKYCGGEYNASIKEACDTMNGITHEGSGLSVKHIRELKNMAETGGATFEAESKIMPMSLKTSKGFPEETYVLLIDGASYASLANDPAWKAQMDRGIIQSADQPQGITGSRFRGMIEGVMVYSCHELGRYRIQNEGNTVAWNLFMGAQALGLCWGMRSDFTTVERDHKNVLSLAVTEIRGQRALRFPSFQNPNTTVERGIIHSFTKIAENKQ